MKRRASRLFVFSTLLALGVSASRAQTNTIFIPAELENAYGNRSADVFYFNENVQQVYAAREFSSAPADILKITEIAFRAEETREAKDPTIDRLVLLMNVFPASMEELVRGKSGLVPPLTTVFDGREILVATKADRVDAFDTRFVLNPPFAYDRRKGQLVLLIAHPDNTSAVASLDAQGIFKGDLPSFDRGAIIYPPSGRGDGQVSATILATRFTYTYSSARIVGVTLMETKIRIAFALSGEARARQIQQATEVQGPYTPAENTIIERLDSSSYQAEVPLAGTNSFFRVALY